MPTFDVYFRSDMQWGMHEIAAADATQALEIARKLAGEDLDDLDYYEACDCLINEIEVCDEEHNQLAVWYDDDMRLRLAAPDLLKAAEKVIARWERGDLAEAVRKLTAVIATAKEGAG